MDIVLLEKIEKRGNIGDVIKVKNGFARNYLFPQKKALRATKENIAFFESKKIEIEKKNNEAIENAKILAQKIDGLSLVVIRGAGDSGHLYGSVSSKDISYILNSKNGIQVDSKCIRIDNPIKEIGIYDLKVVLHADVKANITINVARSEDEANNAIKKIKTLEKSGKKDVTPVSKENSVNEDKTSEESNLNAEA